MKGNKQMTTPKPIVPPTPADDTPLSIAKPGEFSLDKFRATQPSTVAGVATLLTALPHFRIPHAKDFVRLHPDEDNYWSPVYCFVNVPIKGQTHGTLHLIVESLVLRHLSGGSIEKFRLVLASKPHDVFFLAEVPDPDRNPDNSWNISHLEGCLSAKKKWTRLISRRDEGVDNYDIKTADEDAFPEPNWPQQSLGQLIETTFKGRMIVDDNDPGLYRLIGKRQSLA
jgi:hypothetical protein